MSDGKAFRKTEKDLSIEDHLKELDRKFSVILERIQVYDKFSNDIKKLSEDIESCKKDLIGHAAFARTSTDLLGNQIYSSNNRITEFKRDQVSLSKNLDEFKNDHEQCLLNVHSVILGFHESLAVLKKQFDEHETDSNCDRQFCRSLEQDFREFKKTTSDCPESIKTAHKNHDQLKQNFNQFHSEIESRFNDVLSSIASMPQFNEWATKIYIKTCNEISDKQKEIYAELDRKARHLEDKLSSDPATAESIKKYLQQQMDTLALDGKNAYLKANNAALQMNILEKKIETINLILKKYELTK
jgi:hypothetical protein